jgi:hypothetical protein
MEGVQHENVEDAGTAEENPEPQSSPEVHDAVANADMLREVFKNLDTLEISRWVDQKSRLEQVPSAQCNPEVLRSAAAALNSRSRCS